jgi:hypothetical protein
MTKYIWEILEEINNDITKINNYKSNTALKLILQNNFDINLKWLLPETTPPYKSAVEPSGMAASNLYMEAKKFYIFRRADLPALKRESLFIQLLESVDPKEAKIVLAIKDQSLTKLYNNITKEVAKMLLPSLT